ncbi:ImmA/IrrE family metallo-endopeptidase [Bacillus songklensis]|uniref:ImmA/IrrE family metallo-endopeptidase n=1 Tax=Bacillus songklensis TaxID=1069116 RepID=A0ABV8AYT8_9BACI
MATYTVDVYAFFVNGADSRTNIDRVKQDISNANRAWKGCIKFVLKGIYFRKSKLIVNASSIPADKVFKNRQIDPLIKSARNATGNKIGIYVLYLSGDYLAEGRARKVIGVGGTELVSFKNSTDYKLFGRVLLTDKAAGRYTLAHEFGHVLFNHYNVMRKKFIHDDPSGPYINSQIGRRDRAHNNDRKNLMFPISPSVTPIVTSQQCQIAKMSKIVRVQNDDIGNNHDLKNIHFF